MCQSASFCCRNGGAQTTTRWVQKKGMGGNKAPRKATGERSPQVAQGAPQSAMYPPGPPAPANAEVPKQPTAPATAGRHQWGKKRSRSQASTAVWGARSKGNYRGHQCKCPRNVCPCGRWEISKTLADKSQEFPVSHQWQHLVKQV